MLTLVLLPGMDGTGVFFRDFIAGVESEFKPLVVAYPDDPSLGYTELEAFARSALPRDEPFLLLGESFSGPIAISIAATNPTGLVGLILCVTFARNPHPLLPLVSGILGPLPPLRLPRFIQRRNLFGEFDSARLRAQLRQVRSVGSRETQKSRLQAIAAVDVTEKLRRVSVPILDLRATRDRVVSRASGDYIRKIRPDAKIADLDAPHLLLQTVTRDAVNAIANFTRDQIKFSN
jgi:pimeloyl-[acyl-carrier protein] methyl ester esterase